MRKGRGGDHLIESADNTTGSFETCGQIAPDASHLIVDRQNLTAEAQQNIRVQTFEPLTAVRIFDERKASAEFA